MSNDNTTNKPLLPVYGILLALNVAIFLFDKTIALGVAVGICHAGIVWLSHRWRDRKLLNYTVTAGIALTILGYLLSPSGSAEWMVILNRLLSIGCIIGVATLCHSNRRNEQVLQQYNQQLSETSAQLKTSNEHLHDKNLQLEQFTYMASHDLQSPLRSICGYNELLLETLGDDADPDIRHWLKNSNAVAENMQQLIKDLLRFAKLDQEEQPFEPVDLNQTLALVSQSLSKTIADKNAELSFEDMPVVTAKAAQMQQLLQNLITNGLKYNESSVPQIKISCEPLDANSWQICVADNGIGINSTDQDKIFKPFRRLHNNETYPGNGIGLACCKKIVDIHGGKLWVESDGKNGCRFCFTMQAPSTNP